MLWANAGYLICGLILGWFLFQAVPSIKVKSFSHNIFEEKQNWEICE